MATNIVLHQIHGVAIGVQEKDGYLNATKACESYKAKTGIRKQPGDWAKTKQASSYIAYVASVTNNRVTDLVIVKQGGTPDEQGTWIHPDLGDAFGSWLSVEYQFEISKMLQSWRQAKSDGKFPQNITGHIERSPERAALELLKDALDVGLSRLAPEIREGIYIEGAIALYPQLRPALEPHKPKLLLESPLLSPATLPHSTGRTHGSDIVGSCGQ